MDGAPTAARRLRFFKVQPGAPMRRMELATVGSVPDEAHFWLNGYVNKQNCRIWSEANPQVYVETPLHPEKLTVRCALWAGGIIGPYFFKNDEGQIGLHPSQPCLGLTGRHVGGHCHGDPMSFVALLENLYTNCSKTFDETVLAIDCLYSSIDIHIKLSSCSQKPYYHTLFQSGRILT
ncbi:uncharacterized protein TNCV_3599491 [Trichonephila clavipes]|nr:uncharacterized protein TNCV_3599491 [Trichonephila clavipes]